MHKHRPCWQPGQVISGEQRTYTKGWRADAKPEGWNKRWRANGQYHNKHQRKRQSHVTTAPRS